MSDDFNTVRLGLADDIQLTRRKIAKLERAKKDVVSKANKEIAKERKKLEALDAQYNSGAIQQSLL